MNISQVAKRTQISAKMIRYYEDIALIPKVIRNDAGYIVGLYGLIFNTAEDGREAFALYFGDGGGNYARYDGGTGQ